MAPITSKYDALASTDKFWRIICIAMNHPGCGETCSEPDESACYSISPGCAAAEESGDSACDPQLAAPNLPGVIPCSLRLPNSAGLSSAASPSSSFRSVADSSRMHREDSTRAQFKSQPVSISDRIPLRNSTSD